MKGSINLFLSLVSIVCALQTAAFAQNGKTSGAGNPPTSKMTAVKLGPPKGKNPTVIKIVTGPVTSALKGKTFGVAGPKGIITVDASKAKIRYKGKFTSLSTLQVGAMVEVAGTMNDNTYRSLTATEVTIQRLPGEKPVNKPPSKMMMEKAATKPDVTGRGKK
jgi:hypothetical protein